MLLAGIALVLLFRIGEKLNRIIGQLGGQIIQQLAEINESFNEVNRKLELLDGYMRNIEKHVTRAL